MKENIQKISLMEKLDVSIRVATRDDVARILEIFETTATSQSHAIPLDSSRPKLTPIGKNLTFESF